MPALLFTWIAADKFPNSYKGKDYYCHYFKDGNSLCRRLGNLPKDIG